MLPTITKDKLKSVWDGLSTKPIVQTDVGDNSLQRRRRVRSISVSRSLRFGRSHLLSNRKASSVIAVDEKSSDNSVVTSGQVVHGELIRVSGCSLETLEALTFYLATRHVRLLSGKHHHFAGLEARSAARDGVAVPAPVILDGTNDVTQRCLALHTTIPAMLATSAYSLASQLGLADLKARSLEHISANLKPDTVLEELLSPLGERFPNVRDAMLKYVRANWETVRQSPATPRVLDRLAKGEFPTASAQLLQLWNLFDVPK